MAYQTHVPIELSILPTSDLLTLIQTPGKKILSILQFTKANGKTYIRFVPKTAGEYRYTDEGKEKKIVVKAYKGSNELFVNGGIQLHHTSLSFENGKPFFWLADTWWYGGTNRMAWREPFQQITAQRKKQGFSVVQIVIGIPPETDAFSPDAKNSGGHPFQKDWSLHPAYFDEVDKKIAYLVDQGIVPCIVGGWGHHMDWMGEEKIRLFWRELIARYSAYPVVFCLAGEIDVFLGGTNPSAHILHKNIKKTVSFLPAPVASFLRKTKHTIAQRVTEKKHNTLLKKRIDAWRNIGEYIQTIDPFHRPLTAHISQKKTAKQLLGNPSWLAIDSIQSGHALDRVEFMVSAIHENRKHCIINMEPWYEGILGNFSAYHQRMAFWMCVLAGAKGHSYGAHGVWQMAEKEDRFMGHWGASFWKDAISYQGATQVGIGKKILSKYRWWEIESDFSVISPCWSKHNLFGVVSARIGDDIFFVYSPKSTVVQLAFPSHASYMLHAIDPENGNILQTISAKETMELPRIKNHDDMLYIAEKTTGLV